MDIQAAIIPHVFEADTGLLKALAKKRKQLIVLSNKYETLSNQIAEIQAEYDLRIGSLLRKITILDNEIQRWHAIGSLTKRGVNLHDALLEVDTQIKKLHQKQEEIGFYELPDSPADLPIEESASHLRKLWRKLAQKYHPDLTDNAHDKKEREKMMKLINNAYAKKDFNSLKALEEKELLEESLGQTNNLEKRLVDMENALIRIQNAYGLLKKSEWYSWRKKSHAEKNALFGEFEVNLIKEMLRKEMRLADLKKMVQ